MTGIIIINKQQDWTSFDVVAKLRRLLGERKIGHAGTLDPMATGVLPVFFGRATRAIEFLESCDKEYVASVRFGIRTDTQDTTGTVLSETGLSPTREAVLAALPEFHGEIEQVPPMYSAIKVAGKKLYEYARKGVELERKPRKVTISELELLPETEGDMRIRVVCSKGTYIRSLCADLGDRLGCGAAMSALERTRVGVYEISRANTIAEVEDAINAGKVSDMIMPVDSVFSALPAVKTDAWGEKICRNGLMPKLAEMPEGRFRIYSPGGEFLAVAENSGGEARVIKSFFEV